MGIVVFKYILREVDSTVSTLSIWKTWGAPTERWGEGGKPDSLESTNDYSFRWGEGENWIDVEDEEIQKIWDEGWGGPRPM